MITWCNDKRTKRCSRPHQLPTQNENESKSKVQLLYVYLQDDCGNEAEQLSYHRFPEHFLSARVMDCSVLINETSSNDVPQKGHNYSKDEGCPKLCQHEERQGFWCLTFWVQSLPQLRKQETNLNQWSSTSQYPDQNLWDYHIGPSQFFSWHGDDLV